MPHLFLISQALQLVSLSSLMIYNPVTIKSFCSYLSYVPQNLTIHAFPLSPLVQVFLIFFAFLIYCLDSYNLLVHLSALMQLELVFTNFRFILHWSPHGLLSWPLSWSYFYPSCNYPADVKSNEFFSVFIIKASLQHVILLATLFIKVSTPRSETHFPWLFSYLIISAHLLCWLFFLCSPFKLVF